MSGNSPPDYKALCLEEVERLKEAETQNRQEKRRLQHRTFKGVLSNGTNAADTVMRFSVLRREVRPTRQDSPGCCRHRRNL